MPGNEKKILDSPPHATACHDGKGSCAVQDVTAPDAAPAGVPRNHTLPNKMFTVANYIGLGWVANSLMSLFITYNVLTTKPGEKFITGLTTKVFEPLGNWYYKNLRPSKFNPKHLSYIPDKARSTAEILCMCIAGCIVLFPMKLMQDHKRWFVEKFDRLINRDYHRDCKEKDIDPSPTSAAEEEMKQTWSGLLTSRLIGMGAVVGIDQTIERFNNNRHAAGKWNVDSAEWKTGKYIFDKLPEKTSDKFIRFFSSRGKGIDGIQPRVLERVLQADYIGNGHNVPNELTSASHELTALEAARQAKGALSMTEAAQRTAALNTFTASSVAEKIAKRTIFAEQFRLFSKEISLTMVTAGLIYAFAKAGLMSKKDKEKQDAHPASRSEEPLSGATTESTENWSAQLKPQQAARPTARAASFQDAFRTTPNSPESSLSI